MASHNIKKGLNVPITGEPKQEIEDGAKVSHVAILAEDYPAMKPKMLVVVGDSVRRGQALFEDRKNPGVIFTALGAGTVTAVNRGAKRALQSVVIELNENEQNNTLTDADFQSFSSYQGDMSAADGQTIADLLVESGLWTAMKERPFGRPPEVGTRPSALFLTCTDTEPLAASISKCAEGKDEDFAAGVAALSTLSDKVYLCVEKGSALKKLASGSVIVEEFSGLHPAGLAGTHIHMLHGASRKRKVWHCHLQDIIAVGHLVRTGKLNVERVISLAGPAVKNPRLLRTRIGAKTDQLVAGQCNDGENRTISGSPISGRIAAGEIFGYLGRYHRQITMLSEGRKREFIGWLLPGADKYSSIPIYLSALFGKKKFAFTTSTNGEHREMVPIGMYERVVPLDILPTFLLRALEVDDTDRAEKLGALELEEEDLALCSFVCPGKQDYSVHLRRTLNQILKEG